MKGYESDIKKLKDSGPITKELEKLELNLLGKIRDTKEIEVKIIESNDVSIKKVKQF